MSFLLLIVLASIGAWALGRALGWPPDHRRAMRQGMALGFAFTGVDHFLSAQERYVPMLPPLLQSHALELVWLTGAAEIAGALGLLLPARFWRQWGWPDLQRQAGIWLAVMMAFLVIANIHVAATGATVRGLEFGAWYYWLRPALQPVFMLWALYGVGVVFPPTAPPPSREAAGSDEAALTPARSSRSRH